MRILTACAVVLVSIAFTPADLFAQGSVPEGLRLERELPSRYPYVVKDAIKHCCPEKGFWVDLGAGKGQVSIPLIEATDNPVIMIDPDKEGMAEGLESARKKGLHDRLTAVVGVAEEMPFLDNSVDFLISRGSIFFWDDPAKGLQEVVRVLRPGGKAYIGGGAGSGYPQLATEKLIEGRKQRVIGDSEEAEKWRRFEELRRPELMNQWAKQAGLENFQVMGKGAVSAEDSRVGQGVWILIEKASVEDK
jgi:ubiquinone/menaquinone biosynthesis C-methylase UbiE